MSDEQIIEKVRKLLALTASPNENEAMLAAEKVQELLIKYNLDLEKVQGKGRTRQRFEGVIMDSSMVTDSVPWIRDLLHISATFCFCKHFFSWEYMAAPNRKSGKRRVERHIFVGQEHNVVSAKILSDYLTTTVTRLSIEAAKTASKSERNKFVVSFRYACAARLQKRVAAMLRSMSNPDVKTATKNALVVQTHFLAVMDELQEFIADQFGEMKTVKHEHKYASQAGALAGDAAGNAISLSKQVGGDAQSSLPLEFKK